MSDSNLPIGSGHSLLNGPTESKALSGGASTDGGMGVTLKAWTKNVVAVFAFVAATVSGFVTVFNKLQDMKHEVSVRSAENDTLKRQNLSLSTTVNTVSSVTQAKLTEAQKHQRNMDKFLPIAIDNGSGGSNSEIVSAEYYPIDGCVHISRKKSSQDSGNVYYGNDQDVWVIDPLRALGAPSGEASEPRSIATPSALRSPQIPRPSKAKLLRVGMFQASCLNPHPGKFTVQNQQLNACSVKVTRTFNDGCRHYQMYNACNGQWDPKINWLACAAQHHP
ncbi:MAG TPA: hypothetical protein VNU92_10115 [Edaphobacter sp.]|nr:hypothetical protein [Edaphobacter sp.]